MTVWPTLPSSRKPSIAACLMMSPSSRTPRPDTGNGLVTVDSMKAVALALSLVQSRVYTTPASLKYITLKMSFSRLDATNAAPMPFASSKRPPMLLPESRRMSHAVPTPATFSFEASPHFCLLMSLSCWSLPWTLMARKVLPSSHLIASHSALGFSTSLAMQSKTSSGFVIALQGPVDRDSG
ncbi:MAG: hypothetical protein IPM79_27410 [Polyangiaceae bacterium]|nr:hypothetical protein [Polyangiaceae bacterium]